MFLNNVGGRSVKLDMPTSQYGTLTVDGREILVHVKGLYMIPLPGGPENELYHYVELQLWGTETLKGE